MDKIKIRVSFGLLSNVLGYKKEKLLVRKITAKLIFLLIIATGVFADEPFFASRAGMVLTTANLNNNGRIERFTRMTTSNVRGSGGNMTIDYTMQILDRNRRPTGKAGIREYNVTVTGGILEIKLDNMMDLFFASREMNYELTAGPLLIPSNMTNGSRIEDSWMNMSVRVPIIGEVTANTKMTNIRCIGIETVTVPAGTFEAYKVTMTSTTETTGWGRSPIINNSTTWYVRGIGAVKTVNFDERGRIESSTELYELIR
jgi:hypothetical protein